MVNIRQAGNYISFFHNDATNSGYIEPGLRAIMLSQLSTTSGVIPMVYSSILILHMTPSWPPSSPR